MATRRMNVNSRAAIGAAIAMIGLTTLSGHAQSRLPGMVPGRPPVSNAGFPTRNYGVRAPFTIIRPPNTNAIGGNRPGERPRPPRFDPPDTIAAPSPPPNTSAPGDAPNPANTVDLPITTGVSINTSVMAPASVVGWGSSSAVYRHASTRGSMGWNRNSYDQQAFDQRLSVYYKPSELAALQAEELARQDAERLPLADRAASALLKGDLDLAHELYLEVLSTSPDDLNVMRTLGVIDLLSRRTDAGVKRILAAHMADPLLTDMPINPETYPDGTAALRRASGEVASLAARPGRADAAFTAALLAQSRNEYLVAGRFLDRAAEGGLDPMLVARMKASLEAAQTAARPQTPGKSANKPADKPTK